MQVIAQALVAEVEQTPRKPPGQIVKYDREFLLKFMDVSGLERKHGSLERQVALGEACTMRAKLHNA